MSRKAALGDVLLAGQAGSNEDVLQMKESFEHANFRRLPHLSASLHVSINAS